MTSGAAIVILILLSYLYNNGNNKHKCGICLQEITKIVMAILRRVIFMKIKSMSITKSADNFIQLEGRNAEFSFCYGHIQCAATARRVNLP